MAQGPGFAFGPFFLDPSSRRLLCDGRHIVLSTQQFNLLHELVSHGGEVLSKQHLLNIVWGDEVVGDNSLEELVFQLRRILNSADADQYIETARRSSDRFVEPVSAPLASRADVDALLEPYRELVLGRRALETFQRTQIDRAWTTFGALVALNNGEADFHVAFANACALRYEATRADRAPDEEALRQALVHAREACRLAPKDAEAWATLGFVLERTGARADAIAALDRSVTLERYGWGHRLMLASASWGQARLRAVQATLKELPGEPLARLVAATVYIARDDLAAAEREVDDGLEVPERGRRERFPAIGLDWLKGLLLTARGADDQALEAFDRELALEARDFVYSRECAASTWYAIGACHLRRGDAIAAERAFNEAIARVPGHLMACTGLEVLGQATGQPNDPAGTSNGDAPGAEPDRATPNGLDVAIGRAVSLVADGDASGAARLVDAALAAAPDGSAGWLIPIEPLLHVQHDRSAWAAVLARLRTRAS